MPDKPKHIRYRFTQSTNTLAHAFGKGGKVHGTIVSADYQIGGKGRLGNSFSSPPGGLYCSVLLRPKLPIESISLITLAAGVACAIVLERYSGLSAQLKWPNDLYFHKKKIGGILTETSPYSNQQHSISYVVVGMGININSALDAFDENLRGELTSLFELTGRKFEIQTIIDDVVNELLKCCHELEDDKEHMLTLWRKRDFFLGKHITWWKPDGSAVNGYALGLKDDGQYQLQNEQGELLNVLAGQLRLHNSISC